MRNWWPTGLWVNPGRVPTRIGGDGILPFLDVPHWFASEVIRVLRRHRVEFRIRHAYLRLANSDDPDDHMDRLIFPLERADRVQALVDSIKRPGWWWPPNPP
jgi:hypothetical protein